MPLGVEDEQPHAGDGIPDRHMAGGITGDDDAGRRLDARLGWPVEIHQPQAGKAGDEIGEPRRHRLPPGPHLAERDAFGKARVRGDELEHRRDRRQDGDPLGDDLVDEAGDVGPGTVIAHDEGRPLRERRQRDAERRIELVGEEEENAIVGCQRHRRAPPGHRVADPAVIDEHPLRPATGTTRVDAVSEVARRHQRGERRGRNRIPTAFQIPDRDPVDAGRSPEPRPIPGDNDRPGPGVGQKVGGVDRRLADIDRHRHCPGEDRRHRPHESLRPLADDRDEVAAPHASRGERRRKRPADGRQPAVAPDAVAGDERGAVGRQSDHAPDHRAEQILSAGDGRAGRRQPFERPGDPVDRGRGVGHEGGQQPLEMAREQPHRVRLEEITTEGDHAAQRAVGELEDQLHVKQARPLRHMEALLPEAAEHRHLGAIGEEEAGPPLLRAELRLLERARHLDQRAARRVAVGHEVVDDRREGIVLLIEGGDERGADAADERGERRGVVEPRWERQHVHEEADGVGETLLTAAGERRADDERRSPRVSGQEHLNGGEHDRRRGDPLRCRQPRDPGHDVGRKLERHRIGPAGEAARTNPVGGELEDGGDPGELLPPDALQLGAAGPGEDRLLAANELGVVALARRQIGDAAGRDHRIDPPDLLEKEDQRPKIDDDVVRGGEDEPVVIGAAVGRHPQERALLEIERPSGIGDHLLPHHFEVGAGDINDEDLRRQRRVNPLPQLAPLVGEGRPQRRMPLDDQLEGPLERPDIERRAHAGREVDVVGGARRIAPVGIPQPLLPRRHRELRLPGSSWHRDRRRRRGIVGAKHRADRLRQRVDPAAAHQRRDR